MKIFRLEICCYNSDSVFIAADAGADRVELCAGPAEGGTTPSFGCVWESLKAGIPVYAMVRPREGDFLYNDREFSEMKNDILALKDAGVAGIVCGVLKSDGSIDIERMHEVVELCGNMDLTFHRAFDMCKDPFKAIDDLKSCGIKRVLTSGLKKTAMEGIELLKKLNEFSGDDFTILAGGGVRSGNIRQLAEHGLSEFHSSAGVKIISGMKFRNEMISMGKVPAHEFSYSSCDQNEILQMKSALQEFTFQ
jgi:copper homeostasis protein